MDCDAGIVTYNIYFYLCCINLQEEANGVEKLMKKKLKIPKG